MDLLDKKTPDELLNSIVAETAKARNELACAQRDLEKANGRMSFVLVMLHKLINRHKD